MGTTTSKINSAAQPKKWGASTEMVVNAILGGHTNLRAISEHTGIHYRSVNAIVTSLEMQDRVMAHNYDVKRGQQDFTVLRTEKKRRKITGYVDHPRNRSSKPILDLAFFCTGTYPAANLSSLARQNYSGNVLVHRLT